MSEKKEKMPKKEKVIVGTSIVCTGIATAAAGYFGIKYLNLKHGDDELNFIKFLVIESDCVAKALQNGSNKLSREETKIKTLVKALEDRPNDKTIIDTIKKHEKEHGILAKQLAKTIKLQELIDADEIIYTK